MGSGHQYGGVSLVSIRVREYFLAARLCRGPEYAMVAALGHSACAGDHPGNRRVAHFDEQGSQEAHLETYRAVIDTTLIHPSSSRFLKGIRKLIWNAQVR